MKRLNITNLLYCSIFIFAWSNVMTNDIPEGFPYLGKIDTFFLGIITGYYIGYAFNSKSFNFDIIDQVDDKAKDSIILDLLNLASKCILFMSFLFIVFPSIVNFILIHFFS